MENTPILSEITHAALTWRIVGAVRRQAKAEKDPKYKHCYGTVRVGLTPLSRMADEWLGSMSGGTTQDTGELKDICESIFDLKLDPDGEKVALFLDSEKSTSTVVLDGRDFLLVRVEVNSICMTDSKQFICALAGTVEMESYFRHHFGGRVSFCPHVNPEAISRCGGSLVTTDTPPSDAGT